MAKFSVLDSKGLVICSVDDEAESGVKKISSTKVRVGDTVLEFDQGVCEVQKVVVNNFTDTFYVNLDDLGDYIYSAVLNNGGSENQADACRCASEGASVTVTVECMVEDGDVDIKDAYLN